MRFLVHFLVYTVEPEHKNSYKDLNPLIKVRPSPTLACQNHHRNKS